MTELAFDDPCILFALRREAQPFLRTFRPQQRFPGAPCWARFCGPAWLPVLVLQTGLGPARTETALEWLLAQPVLGRVACRPKVVLATGFAGALHQGRRVGDVILATEVITPGGGAWRVTWPAEPLHGQWRPPLHRGRILTVPRLLADPKEKLALGARHDALAADMETAAVARACSRQGMPFGCVRVISDDVDTPLSPRLLALLAGGRVSPLRVLTTLFRSPRTAGEFWRLARQTRFAAEQLGKALGELLTLTLPWSAEL